MLVGITGFAGSGKDTAAQTLIDAGFERRAFADPLRTGLLALNPWVTHGVNVWWDSQNEQHSDPTAERLSEVIERVGWDYAKWHYPEIRQLLQRYGTEAGRDVHGQLCWIKATENTMEVSKHYVITDVRFPNERDYIQQQGGLVIRICRDGVGAANEHSSEQVLDDVDVGVFNNGSIEALHDEIRRIVGEWYPTSFTQVSQPPILFGGVQLSELPRFDDHQAHINAANEMRHRIKAANEANLRSALTGLVQSFEHVYGPLSPPPHDLPLEAALKFYADRYPSGNGGIGGEREQTEIETALSRIGIDEAEGGA